MNKVVPLYERTKNLPALSSMGKHGRYYLQIVDSSPGLLTLELGLLTLKAVNSGLLLLMIYLVFGIWF